MHDGVLCISPSTERWTSTVWQGGGDSRWTARLSSRNTDSEEIHAAAQSYTSTNTIYTNDEKQIMCINLYSPTTLRRLGSEWTLYHLALRDAFLLIEEGRHLLSHFSSACWLPPPSLLLNASLTLIKLMWFLLRHKIPTNASSGKKYNEELALSFSSFPPSLLSSILLFSCFLTCVYQN